MKRAFPTLIVALSVATLAILPVGATDHDDPVTVTDALGRPVSLDAPPERIVTAGRAVLMIADVLYAFDEAPEHLVGVGRINQGRGNFLPAIDPDYDQRTILERNVGPEQIAALRPDLVVLKTFMRDRLGRRLEALEIPVAYVELETPEQYQQDIMMLGRLLGEESRAREITAFYRRVTEQVSRRTTAIPARRQPETLLLLARSNDDGIAFQVPPTAWIQTRLVELAGGTPVWTGANPGGGWGTVSFEQIAAWDPDEIVLVAYDGSAASVRDRLAGEPRWQALTAVATGAFHAMPTDFYSWDQPDTRWVLGLQWLASRLQPELFADIDPVARAREFFSEIYGLTDREFDRTIEPMMTGDLN